MNRMSFFARNKKKSIILSILLIGIFLYGRSAYAGPVDVLVTQVIGWTATAIVSVVGWITSAVIKAIIQFAQYNNFTKEVVISDAWVIVRDLSNMFFILILLVIAFATILRVETYQVKKLLPKLLIMAVLINFSKTISGLIIDFAQVIMLTFVSAFADGGGNFVATLKINKFLEAARNNAKWNLGDSLDLNSTVAGMLTGVIFMIITGITMIVLLAVLVMRIVMLWIYIILSPLAFLLSAFPSGQKYSQQWWSDFTKQVVTGPILAFFIWLALMAADKINITVGLGSSCIGSVAILCPGDFINFVVAIGMLVGGLIVTQQAGGAAGAAAGKGMAALSKGRALAKGAAGGAMFWAGRQLDTAQMKAQKKISETLGFSEYYAPKSLNYRVIKEGWKRSRAEKMEKYEAQHGGLGNVWHDNFNKYVRLEQYAALRKGRKQQATDIKQAEKLDEKNKLLDQRIRYAQLDEPKKLDEAEKLNREKGQRKSSLVGKGFTEAEAEAELEKDRKALMTPQTFAEAFKEAAKKEQEANNNEITKLREEKLFGPKWATQYEPRYWKSGAKAQIEKHKKEIMERTNGKDFSVISELLQSLKENEPNKMAAALEILSGNNDLNEALKDSRVIHLMTKEGGLIEKYAEQQEIIDETGEKRLMKKEEIEKVKDDFRNNPVTLAYNQAMIQQMFKETGLNDNLTGRYADKIGSISFASGNSLGYAMAKGDASTGSYIFNRLKVKNGALVVSDDRMAAINGKFANLESQQKMKSVHPDVFIKEAPDGSATHISDEGISFLKTLTAHDLGQINRMRLDVIRKIGKSDPALRDLKNLVDQLRQDGSHDQAELVKAFAGYIISKYSGKSLSDEKFYPGAVEAYETKMEGKPAKPKDEKKKKEKPEEEEESSSSD